MMGFSQSSVASLSDGNPAYGKKSKLYNDPIHGFFRLSSEALSFIDTPQFQRLRELKQLGVTSFVFPGAVHDRFQHSVGVYHLSAQLVEKLQTTQPELHIERGDSVAVAVAGLVHDLGHGPYSHVFDNEFIPRVEPGAKFSHEEMGLDILDWAIDDNQIETLDTIGKQKVRDMIVAAKPSATTKLEKRDFLYQIVANGKNSIDTDKFDYLARDTYFMGMKSTFDFRRLMVQNRVIDGEICFHSKEVYSVQELFHTRYTLFKNCYVHRAGKAVEYMITDAMVEANAVWGRRLSNAIQSPEEYCKLSDAVVQEIEYSSDPAMAKAQGILKDLRRRILYKFVDEFIIPQELAERLPKIKPIDITTMNQSGDVQLEEDDVIVHDHKLNYGNKDRDPLSTTRFYRESEESSFLIDRSKVSYILPAQYEERVVRVYSRRQDTQVHQAIQQAFRRLLRKYKGSIASSPSHTSSLFKSPARSGLDTSAMSSISRNRIPAAAVSGSSSVKRALLTQSVDETIPYVPETAEHDLLDSEDEELQSASATGAGALPSLADARPKALGGSKRPRRSGSSRGVKSPDNPWSMASKASKRP